MFKKFTILLIPEGAKKVKRLTLPRLVLPLLFIVLFSAVGMAGYWFQQYQSVCKNLPNVQALQRQTDRQQAQVESFYRDLGTLKDQMTQLKQFNRRLRILANLEKPSNNEEAFGVGGPDTDSAGTGLQVSPNTRERRMQYMRRDLDQLVTETEMQREVQRELAKFLQERRSVLAATPSIWPVHGWVTSGFGYRISPFTGKRAFHSGLDISSRMKTPIIAPADGVVTFRGVQGGFGRMIVINHGHGIVTRYAHLSKYNVKVGQKVKRGDNIALLGNSGRSTGPHLHYEVLLSGVPTNPRYYILD